MIDRSAGTHSPGNHLRPSHPHSLVVSHEQGIVIEERDDGISRCVDKGHLFSLLLRNGPTMECMSGSDLLQGSGVLRAVLKGVVCTLSPLDGARPVALTRCDSLVVGVQATLVLLPGEGKIKLRLSKGQGLMI